MATSKRNWSWTTRILLGTAILLLTGGVLFWCFLNQKFEDTAVVKPAFTVKAIDMIGEFTQNDSLANKKYTEKMVVVNGRITEMETADTTTNIKFTDSLSGSYIIFEFQAQHAKAARNLQVGDLVSLKGSCSGSIYSQLRKAHMISFKRAVLNQ